MRNIILTMLCTISFCSIAEDHWVGTTAPNFDLPDQSGIFHELSDYKGKWLILYFYPKDDTPGCTAEAKAFTNDAKELTKLNAEIIGVSLDDVESHKDFAEKYNIPYTLLADKDGVMATAYKVIKSNLIMRYAQRQTFIINPEGLIAKHYPDVSPAEHSTQIINDLIIIQGSNK